MRALERFRGPARGLLRVLLRVFEVVYSPFKAFGKITEELDVRGAFLVLVLTMSVAAATDYVVASKIFVERSVLDATPIPSSEPCEIAEGFSDLDVPRKIGVFTSGWTNGSDVVTVYGENATSHEVVEEITIAMDNWTYYTAEEFAGVSRITFSRGDNGSYQYVALKVHPEEYACLLAGNVLSELIIPSFLSTVFRYVPSWIMYVSFLWAFLKLFPEKGSWWRIFVVVGYAFAPRFVYALINTLLLSGLPAVSLPLESNILHELREQIFQESWYSAWTFRLGFMLTYAIDFWVVALSTIALRHLCELRWKKGGAVSLAAYAVNFLLSNLGRLLT